MLMKMQGQQKKGRQTTCTTNKITVPSYTARPMIQDFQQLTARRIEGQCIYCTTNVFAYKKYCRMRLVLFAGATPANLQQQHTHIILCWPAASLQSTDDTHPQPADSCLVVWDATAVVAAVLTLYTMECRCPRLHARPSRDVRSADADGDPQEILRFPDIRGRLAPESSRTDVDH